MKASDVNYALMCLTKRAEKIEPDRLVETFVQEGPLFASLASPDHQILYGRRGTGKTHALQYLTKTTLAGGHVAVYVDLQTIGSTGGLYSNPDVPLAEVGTRLLVDALGAIHAQLHDYALAVAEEHDMEETLNLLDRLADGITEVKVHGEHEQGVQTSETVEDGSGVDAHASLGLDGLRLAGGGHVSTTSSRVSQTSLLIKGLARHWVHFGSVFHTMQALVKSLPGGRLMVVLDEWTDTPMHLQPLLADLLRRSLFPVGGLTVKIGAIEHRARFAAERDMGGYLGIEVGADAAADIDLDDFMVFGNNEEHAIDFFATLLSRHAEGAIAGVKPWESADEFMDLAFASRETFAELVRAAEGVPRDAINIVAHAARSASDRKISLKDIRDAAHTWYCRDKEKPVNDKEEARRLLHWIIDRVIGDRKARAFLLQQGHDHHLIDWLYDARVLHVIKRGIASKQQPGVRFWAYQLDYGCYVDLLSTQRAPAGLFETTEDKYLDVPPDEIDAIRGAVLTLQDFLDEQRPISAPDAEIRWLTPDEAEGFDEGSNAQMWLLYESESEVAAVSIEPGSYLIGSERHCDIRLVHPSVAAEHLTLEVRDAKLVVSCDRQNRTSINNVRVVRGDVVGGDTLRIGQVSLRVVGSG